MIRRRSIAATSIAGADAAAFAEMESATGPAGASAHAGDSALKLDTHSMASDTKARNTLVGFMIFISIREDRDFLSLAWSSNAVVMVL
jgi:hypothetical protein